MKIFSCLFPRLMGLPLELQSDWVRASYKAVAESEVEVCHWQACFQGLGWVWILSGLWVNGTAANTLFQRVALNQGSTSGSTFGSSKSNPITRHIVDVAPTRSLGRLLPGHWIGPWMESAGLRSWLRGIGNKLRAILDSTAKTEVWTIEWLYISIY